MPPGRYPHRMRIQTSTYVDDVETWTNLQGGSFWGRIVPISGREFTEAQAVGATETHRIYARYRSTFSPDRRLAHKGRIFNIVSAINVGEHARETEIVCKEVIN